jgi:hypothetical protein
MHTNSHIILIFFICLLTKGQSQHEHLPDFPMYKWLGEWTITELDKEVNLDDYLSMMPMHQRLKVELMEDKTSVLSTHYLCFGGECESFIKVYVPSLDKCYGITKFGKIEISYPDVGKELTTMKFFAGYVRNSFISETQWHSQDSATTTFSIKEHAYLGKRLQEKEKRTVYTRLINNILPLPETPEEIGQHLDQTLKKLAKSPFDFADQFISLEKFHDLTQIDTSGLNFFWGHKPFPKTELERIHFLNYDYFNLLESVDNYWISWPGTTYLEHSTSLFESDDSPNNNKRPFHQVDFRFEYRGKEYSLKALYLQLMGKYHLVYIKHKIYQ